MTTEFESLMGNHQGLERVPITSPPRKTRMMEMRGRPIDMG